MSLPYMKFYPRDWRGDQALRSVSVAARGLWMECLCIMHEAKPYGHLLLNGDPVGDDTLARMSGVPVDEVLRLMAELRQAGVLRVTRNGIVFSRRMTKDHARAQKGKAAVEKRWNTEQTDRTQAPDTEQKSDAPNRLPNRTPITQKPEARVQKERDANASSSLRDFDRFWEVFPKKVEKKTAKAKFISAIKGGADPERIIAAAQAYARSETVIRGFVKHPTTWLNAGCWDDETTSKSGATPEDDRATWRARMAKISGAA